MASVRLYALLEQIADLSKDKASLEMEVKRLRSRVNDLERYEREEIEAESTWCAECRIVRSVISLEEAFNQGVCQ